MKNKKMCITIAIIFLIAFFLSCFLVSIIYILYRADRIDLPMPWVIIPLSAILFTLFGLSEGFFIKSGIVPKAIKYFIYFKWGFVPFVMILAIISMLF